MTVPATIPTGKNNVLASLRKYLSEQLAPTVVQFENYMNVEQIPSIAFQDVGVPNLGGHAFDDYLGERIGDSGFPERVYGKIAQTNLEFNILTDQENNASAIKDLFQMRDRLEYLFMYSGRKDEAGVLIMPRIAILDFDNSNEDTGASIWCPQERDSIWIENYVGTDQERPNVKRLRILVRVYWHLLRP